METNKYFKQHNNNMELYCCVLLIPLIFSSIIQYTFVSFFNGYILFCVYAFSFACLLIFNRRQKNTDFDMKSLLAFLCFDIVYLFTIYLSTSDVDTGVFSLIFFSVAVLYAFGVVYNATNFKMLKYISVLAVISISISVVLSVVVLLEQPGASRILASSETFEVYGASDLRRRGLAGFGVTYSLVFFIPIIFHWLKRLAKMQKILMISLLALIVINILLAGYTIALILSVFAVIIYFFTKMKNKSKVFCVLFLILFLLVQSQFLPDFLYYISEFFDSKKMSEHIVEIADVLNGKLSIFELNRINLSKQSLEAFLSNPLFGGYANTSNFEIGGHSTFFDVLGTTGLLGFVPYCLFLYFFHRQVKKQIKNISTKKVWTVETIVFWALQILNPIMANYEIVYAYMCIAPASLLYIDMLGENK